MSCRSRAASVAIPRYTALEWQSWSGPSRITKCSSRSAAAGWAWCTAGATRASALDHPNICTIHDVQETVDGQLFVAMAFYQGETLEQRLARGPLDPAQAVALAAQAASGLTKAHAAGIVHRDIKPANLMVTTDGTLKILDFGIAKTGADTITAAGAIAGKPAYLAPELLAGRQADARADLWSLGVVLWEMLRGETLFRRETTQETLAAVLRARVDLAALPSAAAAIIGRVRPRRRGRRSPFFPSRT
ncbi:MAG TPA: serine/threonine-protein kinase [Thermoanaerobaculia bacterium]|nr:serine/threonine-protein kinase [Thermoanaerobaculia bacterium]